MSAFDSPLASRFDENDAVVYVRQHVKVPWDRVFAVHDLRIMGAMWHATPAHVMPELPKPDHGFW